MSSDTGQTSSNLDTHSDEEFQLLVLTQQNKRLIHKIQTFKITHFKYQDELNLMLNTAKQLKNHYFAVELQVVLSLPDKAFRSLLTMY